jgi:very-short-patch-repair endonuclease
MNDFLSSVMTSKRSAYTENGVKYNNVYLKKNEYTNLIIEKQKKFHWLGKQSLDFYLPEHNIAIEYQGRQHFEPVDKFGGKKEFEKTKNRDKRKRELCKKNGIKLLYFSFDEKITTFLGEKVYHNVKDLQL